MADYRNTIPSKFTVGESFTVEKSFADYPATVWTLTYSFRGAGTGFDATAIADGSDFLLSVTTANTANMSAGRYDFEAFVSDGTSKIRVDSGIVQVLPSLSAMGVAIEYDGRSQIKIILDNLDAMIAGKATADQLEYSIGSRQLKRYSMKEVMDLRKHYAGLYAAELRAERMKNGGSLFKNHYTQFNQPK